tara:strand:- start:385 stop:2208 length:1824 start_codon:yes stop_codon:yes gene_type:complete
MKKLNAETLDTLFANPNVQNMAELIGKYESNNQYDINVGGAKIDISDGSKHPRQFDVKTKEGKSSAAGRYQITSTTFDDITSQNPQAEITDFSPTSQNRAFVLLLQRRKALEPVLKGDYTTAVELLANEFASLPSAKTSQPRKGYDEVERDFAFYKRPKIVPRELAGDLPPVTPDQIKNANFSIFGEFVSPYKEGKSPTAGRYQQPSSYDIAASIQFLSENQTQSEKDFLSAVSLGAMPKKGKIDPLSKFLKESAQDETALDVMVEKQEPRNKVPSIEGVKKFQDGGEVEFKMPRSALVGDDIIEIPESQRKVTLTMNDLENLADAASFVPVPQVKFPAKATKGIMSLLKLDKIDPFLKKDYLKKLEGDLISKEFERIGVDVPYVQNKLEKAMKGYKPKPEGKLRMELLSGEIYEPGRTGPFTPGMGDLQVRSPALGSFLKKRETRKDPKISYDENYERSLRQSIQNSKESAQRALERGDTENFSYYEKSSNTYKDMLKQHIINRSEQQQRLKEFNNEREQQILEKINLAKGKPLSYKERRKQIVPKSKLGKAMKKIENMEFALDDFVDSGLAKLKAKPVLNKKEPVYRDQGLDQVYRELMKRQQGR